MTIAYLASLCLLLAVLHTFCAHQFSRIASLYRSGSVGENFFHLLAEVEVVFGLWAGIFVGLVAYFETGEKVVAYLDSLSYHEPWFVFVVMSICSTQPIISLAQKAVVAIAGILPVSRTTAFLASVLTVGPLLGSFITEPAAMTISAILLAETVFTNKAMSVKFKYALLGLLFVNISIGGTLTHFAAPPVLMVANKWNWDTQFMLLNFGWRAVCACIVSTVVVLYQFRNELRVMNADYATKESSSQKTPFWVSLLHVLFLGLAVSASHHLVLLLPVFLFFLGIYSVTREYQSGIRLREAMLVGFFLGGLVVLGNPQGWWITPLIKSFNNESLFFGVAGLTAFTDNAAITYFGSLVSDLSDSAKYALVAGSVVGGGLTVMANAPNPAGYGILYKYFGEFGISPLGLLKGAAIPTLIALVFFTLGVF